MPADLFIDTIYSEDLSDEQDYGGIRIINPFKVGASAGGGRSQGAVP
jgi:hypothetical protein